MDKLDWLGSLVCTKARHKLHLGVGSRVAGRPVLSVEDAGERLYQCVQSGAPFMACRFGSVELRLLADVEAVRLGLKKAVPQEHWDTLYYNAGFFPNDIHYAQPFAALYFDLLKESDLLAVWNNPHEDYMIRKYAPQTDVTVLRALEPWYTPAQPWTAALEGKKLLVIHPFTETIQKQYQKRELLFPGTQILPPLQELFVVKAVQTMANERDDRFATWFDALDYMVQQAMELDFDVAIIGCGAYGLPLAARLKQNGKQAVHLGGATQLLFGIKGGRWDAHPIISKLYNEHWVRPDESETFQDAKNIEGGCYW